MGELTATEAQSDQYLEAERVRHQQRVRLEIVQTILRTEHGLQMSTAEVVAAAKTIEAFVVEPQADDSAREQLVKVDGISADVRRRRDLLAAAKAIEDGLAAAGISLIDEPNGGTTWQQRDAPARGFVSKTYGNNAENPIGAYMNWIANQKKSAGESAA